MKPTLCSYRESNLVWSNGECDLHPQEHPIVGKILRLDDFLSFDYGILDLFESIMDSLEILFLASLLQLVSLEVFPVSRLFTKSMSMRPSFLDDVLRN